MSFVTPTIVLEISGFFFQRIILELNQTLRLPVEQAIHTGKRLYTPDQKDNSGLESAGMYVCIAEEEEEEKEVVSFFPPSSSSSLSFVLSFNHWMS